MTIWRKAETQWSPSREGEATGKKKGINNIDPRSLSWIEYCLCAQSLAMVDWNCSVRLRHVKQWGYEIDQGCRFPFLFRNGVEPRKKVATLKWWKSQSFWNWKRDLFLIRFLMSWKKGSWDFYNIVKQLDKYTFWEKKNYLVSIWVSLLTAFTIVCPQVLCEFEILPGFRSVTHARVFWRKKSRSFQLVCLSSFHTKR